MRLWSTLKDLDARVEASRKLVERMARPWAPVGGREMLTILEAEVAVQSYNFQEQSVRFYNGDLDTVVINQLGVRVAENNTPSSDTTRRRPMDKTPEGFLRTFGNSTLYGTFDFLWNYEVMSRQSMYGRNWSSSDMLSGLDKGRMLAWRTPLRIPRGETVIFRVKPTRFDVPQSASVPTVGAIVYYVTFIGLGYRERGA